MAFKDKDFGRKLEIVQRAIGFRFKPAHFANNRLAKVVGCDPSTMCRKKNGGGNVTGWDMSKLAEHFDLPRFGIDSSIFAEPLPEFELRISLLEQSIDGQAPLDGERKFLVDLAHAARGRIEFDQRTGHRGGIGTEPMRQTVPLFRESSEVRIRLTVPGDGHLIVLNDDGRHEISGLMPSYFAPNTAVRAGTVTLPNDDLYPYFPVAGPAGDYRLIAVWLPEQPQLALLQSAPNDAPRDLSDDEFRELAGLVRRQQAQGRPFLVLAGEYRVE